MKTLINFLKYSISNNNSQSSYIQMRNEYALGSNMSINAACMANSILRRKYKINKSKGIIGELNKEDVAGIVKRINVDGYFIFPKLASDETVVSLLNFAKKTPLRFFQVDKNGKADFSTEEVLYETSKNRSNRHDFVNAEVFKSSETILNLCQDNNFLHIANEYLETRPILDIITMWWSNSLEQVEKDKREALLSSSAQMYHFDMDRLKFIKFFIYLTDVDTNNGPHVFVKGSHRKLPTYINSDGRYADKLVEEKDGANITEITGKAGTIIAVDTRGLHKGKPLVHGERLIFQLEFANSMFDKPEIPGLKNKLPYNMDPQFFESYNLFFKQNT